VDWTRLLVAQLEFYWDVHLWPRLQGLTDEEYLWEPVEGCWTVRPGPDGAFVFDRGRAPDPPPVTTIAWRMAHLIVGILGQRAASHFGAPPIEWDSHAYAGSAAGALNQLDEAYAQWTEGVRGLGEDGLARPCGPAEGPYAELPLAALVLHINREAIHHAAEIALLRDLYRRREGGR